MGKIFDVANLGAINIDVDTSLVNTKFQNTKGRKEEVENDRYP